MVRSGYGKHTTVATGSDSGDQVSVNAWNANINDAGMLGFTPSTKTIASGKITPVDTVTIVAAETGTADDLDLITYSETNANDILYLFADSGDTITVRYNQSPGAGEAALITTSAANVTLSETVPLVLQRRGTTFYQIIENSISSVTATSTTTFTNKSIDLTDNTLTGTSAELATAISDETGSGSLVFGTSPTFVTPVLGTPASGALTNCTFPTLNQSTTGTASNVTGTVAVATGGTGSTTASAARTALGVAIGSDVQAYNSATALTTNKISDFAATTSAELAGTISDETGSGALVFGTAPTITLANGTGLPPAGVTGTAAILGANTFTGNQSHGDNVISLYGTGSDLKIHHNGTNNLIEGVAGNMLFYTPVSTFHRFLVNNVAIADIDANGININGTDIDNIQNLVHDISASPGTGMDFSTDQLQTLSRSTTTTFNGSNYAAGRSKTLKLLSTSGSSITLGFDSSWKFVGVKPTALAAGKTAILTLTCFGSTAADVIAAYAVEA